MNQSGRSVQEIMAFFKLTTDCLLVVHDDIELAPGEVGLKFGGGLAGHNGLRSITAVLGTREYYRLRIGVGRPLKGGVSSYVLKRLTRSEIEAFDPALEAAAEVVFKIIETDNPASMLVNGNTGPRIS